MWKNINFKKQRNYKKNTINIKGGLLEKVFMKLFITFQCVRIMKIMDSCVPTYHAI